MPERMAQRVSDFAADWAAPILMGLTTAAVVWTIWYLTKSPCTAVAATNGLCNPGIVARFINVEILLQSGGAALAVGALKGGYDRAMMRRMINEEREARQQAEQQLAEARKENEQRAAEARKENEQRAAEARKENEQRAAEARKRNDEAFARNEEARKRNDEAFAMLTEMINELREERRQNAAIQQALLDAIIKLGQQNSGNGNGNGRSENSDA